MKNITLIDNQELAKTAIIMTCLFPDLNWVATCGANRLEGFLKRNRDVRCVLFPDNDLSGKRWVDIATRGGHEVYNAYWENCTEGEDIADVALRDSHKL